jgi:hypothetical protein
MEYSYKCNHILFDRQANPIVANSNQVVFPTAPQLLKADNFRQTALPSRLREPGGLLYPPGDRPSDFILR